MFDFSYIRDMTAMTARPTSVVVASGLTVFAALASPAPYLAVIPGLVLAYAADMLYWTLKDAHDLWMFNGGTEHDFHTLRRSWAGRGVLRGYNPALEPILRRYHQPALRDLLPRWSRRNT